MSARPVVRDDASATFFDGTRAGEFLLVLRRDTGEYLDLRTPPPEDVDLEPVPASGSGRVVSWAVVYDRPTGAEPERTTVAVVELDEGPWWWCRLVVVDPDADLHDVHVVVEFVASGPDPDHEVIPVFRPVEGT